MVMTMTRLPLAVIASSLALALLLVTAPQARAQSMAVNFPANFESPAGGWSYNPVVTAAQPWTWFSNQGGIASQGSPWDAPPPATPPSPGQYAFIQTSPGGNANKRVGAMWTTLTGLTTGASYRLTLWYGARSDGFTKNTTNDQLIVFYNGIQVYQSPANVSDLAGFTFATSTFTATAASGVLNVTVVSLNDLDRALLVDSVLVQAVDYAAPPTSLVLSGTPVSTIATFESPSVNGTTYGPGVSIQSYWYNPPLTTTQSWVWPYQLGGVALRGSPWDPPTSVVPADSTQYAFVQTSPNMATGLRHSNMTSSIANVVAGSRYVMSFWWAARSANVPGEQESGYQTQSQLTILVNGVSIYQSAQNLTDASGWQLNRTDPFTVTSGGTVSLVFDILSLTDHDHTLLFDNVNITLVSAGAAASSSSSSSSSGSVAASSSSSSAAASSSSSSVASSSVAASSSAIPSSSSAAVSSSARPSSSSSSAAASSSSSSSLAPSASSSGAASSSSSLGFSSDTALGLSSSNAPPIIDVNGASTLYTQSPLLALVFSVIAVIVLVA